MFSLLPLLAIVAPAHAEEGDFASLLTQAKGSLLAGDYRAARDLLTSAEEVAPESTTLISQQDLARMYFYRGVLFWRASPESAALDAWRQTLTVAPDFQPEPDLLGDQSERDVFLALLDEVKARGEITVDLPEDPGEAVIYIDGRALEPTDSVIAGSHLVQIKCEGGDIEGSWYAFGAPPKDYLVICEGGAYKSSSKSSSSSSKSSSGSKSGSSSSSAKSSSGGLDDKPEKKSGGGLGGKDIAGITLIGLGVAGGGASVFLYDSASKASVAYDKKWEAAEDNPDDADLRDAADDYYDDVLTPRYYQFYGAAAASAAFLATGVVLVIVDAEGPMVAPLPGGGGMFTWSGRF